jgi:hypothetical protein
MQVVDGSGFNIRIMIPGDQSAYSEEDLDLVFDKISFFDGTDTMHVDLKNTALIISKSNVDKFWKEQYHNYYLDLTR